MPLSTLETGNGGQYCQVVGWAVEREESAAKIQTLKAKERILNLRFVWKRNLVEPLKAKTLLDEIDNYDLVEAKWWLKMLEDERSNLSSQSPLLYTAAPPETPKLRTIHVIQLLGYVELCLKRERHFNSNRSPVPWRALQSLKFLDATLEAEQIRSL